MTRLKHTAHIKTPHHSNPQKTHVSTSKHLVSVTVMPKYGRGPMHVMKAQARNVGQTARLKAWKELPITFERQIITKTIRAKKKGEKARKVQALEELGGMISRAKKEQMRHDPDSTWLKYNHKKRSQQHYKTF